MLAIDHLVVAARTLAEGAAWIEARLGVAPAGGGKHAAMGTHNRLLSLGPGRYLEVIAIDPDAPPPGRPRWFALDDPATKARLAKGPALLHWVARADDIERALRLTAFGPAEVLALARGPYRWRIGVPADGALARGGTAPTVIAWDGAHPAAALPDAGCRLERIALRGADAAGTLATLHAAGLDPDEPVVAEAGAAGLAAWVKAPRGTVALE